MRQPWFGIGLLLLLMHLPQSGLAQGVAPIRPHTFEINGAVGYTYGIDERAGNQSRVLGGGTFSYALTRFLLPYVEYTYFPGISRVQSGVLGGTGRPYTSAYSIPLQDFHGGVHLRFSKRESHLAPYAVIGMGVLRNSKHDVQVNYDTASGLQSVTLSVPSDSNFAVNFGAGLRVYINQHWGVRGEGKAYKPTGAFTDVFGKVEGGVFYQF